MGHSDVVETDVEMDLFVLFLLFSTSLRRNSTSLSLACNKSEWLWYRVAHQVERYLFFEIMAKIQSQYRLLISEHNSQFDDNKVAYNFMDHPVNLRDFLKM